MSSLEISRNNLETAKNQQQQLQQSGDVLSFPCTLRCAFNDDDDDDECNEVLRLHPHESQKPSMSSPQQLTPPDTSAASQSPLGRQQKSSSIEVSQQVEKPSAQNKQHNHVNEALHAQLPHHYDQECATHRPAIALGDNEEVADEMKRKQATVFLDSNSAQSHSAANGEAFSANRDCEEGGDAVAAFAPKDDADSAAPGTYRNLFVSRLPLRVQHEDLAQLFAPYNARTATIMTDAKTGRSKGFGFVLFDTEEEGIIAHNALNKAKIVIKGVTLVLRTLPSKHDADKDKGIQVSPVLYVRNVPKSATKEDVERMLEAFGSVIFCAMREEPDGLPVWVILVEYDCQQCADNALSHLRHNTTLYPGRRPPVIAKYAKAMDRRRHPQKADAISCPFRSGVASSSLQPPSANTATITWSNQTHLTAMSAHVHINNSTNDYSINNNGCSSSSAHATTLTRVTTAPSGHQTHDANSNVNLFVPQTLRMSMPTSGLPNPATMLQQQNLTAAFNFRNNLSPQASRYQLSNGTLALHQGDAKKYFAQISQGNNEERFVQKSNNDPFSSSEWRAGTLAGLVSTNNSIAQHPPFLNQQQSLLQYAHQYQQLHRASITPTTTSFSTSDTSNMSPALLSENNPTGTAHNNLSSSSTIPLHYHHSVHQRDSQQQKQQQQQEVYLYSGDVGGFFSGASPSSHANNSAGGQTSAFYEDIAMLHLPKTNSHNAGPGPYYSSAASPPPFFFSPLNNNTISKNNNTTNEISGNNTRMNINANQAGGVEHTSDTFNLDRVVPIDESTSVGHGTLFHHYYQQQRDDRNLSNNGNNPNSNSNGSPTPLIISGACLPQSETYTTFSQHPSLLHSMQLQQQVLNQTRGTTHLRTAPNDASTSASAILFNQESSSGDFTSISPLPPFVDRSGIQYQQQLASLGANTLHQMHTNNNNNNDNNNVPSRQTQAFSHMMYGASDGEHKVGTMGPPLNHLPQRQQQDQRPSVPISSNGNANANNQQPSAAFGGNVHQRLVAEDPRVSYFSTAPIMSIENPELQQQQQQQRPPPFLFLQQRPQQYNQNQNQHQQGPLTHWSQNDPPRSFPPPAYVHHPNSNQNHATAMSFAHFYQQQQQQQQQTALH